MCIRDSSLIPLNREFGYYINTINDFSAGKDISCLLYTSNVLKVVVDSTERPDIPPHGYVVDYLTSVSYTHLFK